MISKKIGYIIAGIFIISIGYIAISKIIWLFHYWDDPFSVGYGVPYFPLDRADAQYTIRKGDDGTYRVEYKVGKGACFHCDPNADDTRSSPIGSTKVSLDQFIDKKVKIDGQFRDKLGQPLCWKECHFTQCPDPKIQYCDVNTFNVIDINTLTLAQ